MAAARAAFPDGRSALDGPERYPARQILETCQVVVARLHRLSEARVVYAQQNPAPIDQGVFLNDVFTVVCGEGAGMLGLSASGSGREKLACCGGHLQLIEVPRKVVSVADALDPACSTPAVESLRRQYAADRASKVPRNSDFWRYLQELAGGHETIRGVQSLCSPAGHAQWRWFGLPVPARGAAGGGWRQ